MGKGTRVLRWHVLTVAAFLGATVLWLGYILYQAGTIPTFGETYTVEAVVPSASLMTPGARVTTAGAEVGSVKKVERATDLGPNVRLTLELDDDRVWPLPVDTTVQIRTRTQVGENYVALRVGRDRDRTIPDGGELGLEQAEELVDIDEILSVLQGPSRTRARTMLQEFGTALTGRGEDLNRTLRGATGMVEYGTQLTRVLHEDRPVVARLVDDLGRLGAAVGDRGDAIAAFASDGTRSLRALADRDAELEETLRELPATLDRVRDVTATVGSVSDRAAPVVKDLARATREVRPAVRGLAPAARETRSVVRALDVANPELKFLLDSVVSVGAALPPALPELRRALCQVNPMLRFLEPYREDVFRIVFHLGSGANSYDALGHMVRLTPIINENSLSGAPPQVLAASRTLLQSGAFLPQKLVKWNPYMKPGEIGKVRASPSDPSNPKELGASGYTYPRVQADC